MVIVGTILTLHDGLVLRVQNLQSSDDLSEVGHSTSQHSEILQVLSGEARLLFHHECLQVVRNADIL